MITLVLGGVRSGKSEVAEQLAGPGPGTYLATGLVAPGDDDFADRVARHRARRPASWATVEEPRAVPGVLARLHGVVLLDALGTWIANDVRADVDGLVEALVSRRGDTVVVSEEVGLGVHPVSEVGRLFADRLGEANRRVAEVADRCLLVVAGRVIELPAGGPPAGGGVGWPPAERPGPSPFSGGVGCPPAERPGSSRSGGAVAPEEPASGPGVAAAAEPGGTPSSGPGGAAAGVGGVADVWMETLPGAGGGPGLRQAVGFLTPLGGAATPTPAAFAWFPLVGALLGLVLGGIWWGTEDRLGPLAAAALVVAADLALTGALHFDGLLDSADGLLPHLSPHRRLAVMADPHVGAFAVAAGASALPLRTAAVAALGSARPLLLAALWSLARTAMAVTALTGRYARRHGLASSFLAQPDEPGLTLPAFPSGPSPAAEAGPPPSSSRPNPSPRAVPAWVAPAAVGGVLSLGLAVADDPQSVVAVLASGLAAAAVAGLARRRIGGFTGDTLGAGGVVAETIGLLVAAAMVHR